MKILATLMILVALALGVCGGVSYWERPFPPGYTLLCNGGGLFAFVDANGWRYTSTFRTRIEAKKRAWSWYRYKQSRSSSQGPWEKCE